MVVEECRLVAWVELHSDLVGTLGVELLPVRGDANVETRLELVVAHVVLQQLWIDGTLNSGEVFDKFVRIIDRLVLLELMFEGQSDRNQDQQYSNAK